MQGFSTVIKRALDDICNHLINLYEEHKPKNNFPVELYADFDNISDQICYKLINYKANKAALEHKPYIPYFDLTIIFYIPIEENNVSGTIDITNTMMKSWNIGTAFHLFDYAHNNTEKIRGLRYGTMQDLMKNIIPTGLCQQECQDLLGESLPPTYVATNTDKLQGACCILYEDALEKFADMIGGSFYILPSSLHEIIMIPSDPETDPPSLILLVRDVNLTALSPDEVLSEYIYFYDEVHNRLSLCTGLE